MYTKRWKRRLFYFRERGWWYALMSPLTSLAYIGLYRYSAVSVGGIRLASMGSDKEQGEEFARVTADALKLIRVHDPRRFRRIQRYVRCIVNDTLDGSGEWGQSMRFCKVDFSRYQVSRSREHYLWYLAWYASVIIHETTHARIFAHYIMYSEPLRARIERLCWQEQRRFLARLPRDQYEFTRMLPAFNEADWLPSWNVTPAEHRRRKIQRIKDILTSKPPTK